MVKTKIYCVVCPKWEIKRPEKCSNTIARGGRKLHFCTRRCKDRYLKAPEKYTSYAPRKSGAVR